MAVRIADREDLEEWLREKSADQAVAIAARAALRALPALGARFDLEKARNFTGPVLANVRAIGLARAAAVYPTRARDLRPTARVAGRAASISARAAYAVAASFPDDARAAAADAARAAADAAADALAAGRRTAATWGQVEMGADALFADRRAVTAIMWRQVEADVRVLESESVATLMGSKLWTGPASDWAADNWTRFKAGLREQDHWGFWIEWYEAIVAGRLLWPELDAKAREHLEIGICLIKDDVWDEGPAVVNAEIERLIKEARPRDPLQPIEGLPSPFRYGVNENHRIGVVAGPQNLPWLPFPAAEADHAKFLDAARIGARELVKDLETGAFNARPDYGEALRRYAEKLPAAPGEGNFILADNEMLGIRLLFEAEASFLNSAFASRLNIAMQQHVALRPYYPEVERLYEAVRRGRMAPPPLPEIAVRELDSVVVEHTPDVFEPEVSGGLGDLGRRPPTLPPPEPAPAEGYIKPPPDPVQTPPLEQSLPLQKMSAYNELMKAVKTLGEVGKGVGGGVAGFEAVHHVFATYGPQIIEWLKHFL